MLGVFVRSILLTMSKFLHQSFAISSCELHRQSVRPDFSQLHILPPQAPIAGSCDCGKVKVQLLQSPEELAIREDNCSICTRASPLQISLHLGLGDD